jgi:hypothetical protein
MAMVQPILCKKPADVGRGLSLVGTEEGGHDADDLGY